MIKTTKQDSNRSALVQCMSAEKCVERTSTPDSNERNSKTENVAWRPNAAVMIMDIDTDTLLSVLVQFEYFCVSHGKKSFILYNKEDTRKTPTIN